ncbi:MAG: molybdopterin-dependent oxidoreductase, partial [Cyclobacteriaceae bacterium]
RYGSQMVVGSRSIQTEFDKLRIMGAAAREMLIAAAAEKWNVPASTCYAKKSTVHGPDGKVLDYGALVEKAASQTPPQDPDLKDPKDFDIIGTEVWRQDIPLKTNGEAVFGIDIQVPGMLYASVERSPVFLGTIRSVDDSEALKVPGVKHVIRTSREVWGRKREGVAVLADTYWAALQGREALKVEWDDHGHDLISGEDLMQDYYRESEKPGDVLFSKGDITNDETWNEPNAIQHSYEMPYQAHVPMEPMNAIVSVKADSVEFWGSTQNPNGIKSFLARTYGLEESSVKINYTFMGGGFGRRSMTDVAEEAADLSAKSGKPVKVIWTREDDQTQGPFRACSLNVCRAILDDSGKVRSFEHKVIAQEIRNQTGNDYTAGRQLMGGITTDYLSPNFTVRGVLQKRHIPISYWRAVYHSTNPFAHECFIDELAEVAGKDPLQFRLDMLDHPRFRRVLEVVAEKTDWFARMQDGVGRGVAMVERSGAHFAMLIEVERKNGDVLPVMVTTALDLGICVNPDTVKAQVEGSVIMGLGAFYQGLTIENGAIVEKNFHTYRLPRIDQTPVIETYLIESNDPPDGAGEAGLPAVAPALANAIYDLTGKRIRKLPVEYGKV